jgi:recombination protein U
MQLTGSNFEALVRRSAKAQAEAGLQLPQRSPRTVGRVDAGGRITGRVVGVDSLDFDGDYLGRRVTFDCKSTQNKSSFPLGMVAIHQAVIVRKAHERGALAFFLVEFSSSGQVYALTWPMLRPWWDNRDYGGRRSIPFAVFERSGTLVARIGRARLLDLVDLVQRLQAGGVPA